MVAEVITYEKCALCNSENIKYKNTFKDEFLSKENFELWQCENCGFQFTQHIPLPENIDKYYQSKEYVSHSDTQQGIIYILYNMIRRQMLNTKKNWIKKYASSTSKTLLDIGCGTGYFAKQMQDAGFEITGIEPNKTASIMAQEKWGRDIEKFHIYENIQQVYHLNKKYDVITLFHVLEHLHHLPHAFKQINCLLNDDGLLVIAVPNRESTDALHYQMNWAAYDMPRHLWHFSYSNMEQFVHQYDMEIIAYKPMIFDSFYVSLLSEKQYLKNKYYLIKGFWWGFCSFLVSFFHSKKSSSLVYFIKKKK